MRITSSVHKIELQKKTKSKKIYRLKKVKAQNFLTNLSYKRVKKEELLNENFIIDCISFILFYLNPLYLEPKFDDATNRDKVETLWTCFIPNEFYFCVRQGENYHLLNKITLKYNTANIIVATMLINKFTNNFS